MSKKVVVQKKTYIIVSLVLLVVIGVALGLTFGLTNIADSFGGGAGKANVTFMYNGKVLQTKNTVKGKIEMPENLEVEGHTFVGWYIDGECTIPFNKEAFESNSSKADITLYAKFSPNKYSVVLETNGGVDGTSLTEYVYGQDTLLPVDWEKPKFSFAGWYNNSSFGGAPIYNIGPREVGAKVLWAKWVPKADFRVSLISIDMTGVTTGEQLAGYWAGDSITLPTDWKRDGFVFAGWFTDRDYISTEVTAIKPTDVGDKTFYAKWLMSFKVTLFGNGGGGANLTNYIETKLTPLPTDWKRVGYEFGGWYNNAAFSGEAKLRIEINETGTKEFHAKWIPIKYKVTINVNGATGGTMLEEHFSGNTDILPINWKKENTEFGGWYSTPNFREGTRVYQITANEYGDKEYWAKWMYKITLVGNGGSGTQMDGYAFSVETPLPQDWTKKGTVAFAGWYSTSNFATGTKVVSIKPTDTGTFTYYAAWEYSVVLNGYGGEGEQVTSFKQGVGVTTLPKDWTWRTGVFGGWFTDDTFTGSNVTSIGKTEDGIKTFYAKWRFAVNLVTNSGTGNSVLTSYIHNIGASLPTNWNNTSGSFEGWYSSSGLTIGQAAAITRSDFGDKTYYAKWRYTVNLVANSGVGHTPLTSYVYSIRETLPTNFSNAEGSFEGWFTSSGLGSGKTTTIASNEKGNKTYYAKWRYTVELVNNTGTGITPLTNYVYSIREQLPTDWKNTEGSFEGWFTSSGLTVGERTEISSTDSGDKKYYAKWRYTVTLNNNSGVGNTPLTSYIYSKGVALPRDWQNTEGSFEEWFTASDFSSGLTTEIKTTDFGNKTFYAKWRYSVNLIGNGGSGSQLYNYLVGSITPLPNDWVYSGNSPLIGWSSTSNGSGTLLTSIDATEFGNKTFYAWYNTNGLQYTLNGSAYAVTGYTGKSPSVVIPAFYNEKPITSIAANAFRDNKLITGINMSYNLVKIGERAFENCEKLQSVILPNEMTIIGSIAFRRCISLTDIVLPSSLSSIALSVFENCSSLKTVNIPNSVLSIGNYAFAWCSSLTSLVLPNSLANIGYYAFTKCSSLTSINIPQSLTTLGMSLFEGCISLPALRIESNILYIEENVFKDCTSLVINCQMAYPPATWNVNWNILDPATQERVPVIFEVEGGTPGLQLSLNGSNYTVTGYTGTIKSLWVPARYNGKTVTAIADNAFKNNTNITTVSIENGVRSIGTNAFSGCSSLTSIAMQSGMISIGAFAFAGCSSATSMAVPNSVKTIGASAFLNCSKLRNFALPSNITAIEASTFEGCESITSLTIPSDVVKIGESAFKNCIGLDNVLIPKAVTQLSSYVFSGCRSFTNYEIPTWITSIGNYVFENCVGFTSFTLPSRFTTVTTGLFKGCSNIGTIVLGNGVTTIGDAAFYECNKITSAKFLPSSVKTIGEQAFYDCGNLAQVSFLGIESIGNRAFYGCFKLQNYKITIPSSVVYVGDSIFRYLDMMTIYVQAPSKPSAWDNSWNYSYMEAQAPIRHRVEWGYNGPF